MSAPAVFRADEALRLVKELGSQKKAAKALGISPEALSRWLRKTGQNIGNANGRYYCEGMSIGDIVRRRFADIYKVDHCPTGACIGHDIPFAI